MDGDEVLRGLTLEQEMVDVAAAAGVTLAALADGTLVGAVVAEAGATSAAERAARCAIAVRAGLPGATIALATGRAVVAGRLPVGDAIDAAASLLHVNGGAEGIWLDAATASMVEGTFALVRAGSAVSLTYGEACITIGAPTLRAATLPPPRVRSRPPTRPASRGTSRGRRPARRRVSSSVVHDSPRRRSRSGKATTSPRAELRGKP
jgi:hypothetical protein